MAIQETAFQWQKYYCFSIVFWRKHQGDLLLSISWVTFWGWVLASSKSRLLEIAVTSGPSYIRTSIVTHSACQRLILCWYLARPDVGITAQSQYFGARPRLPCQQLPWSWEVACSFLLGTSKGRIFDLRIPNAWTECWLICRLMCLSQIQLWQAQWNINEKHR